MADQTEEFLRRLRASASEARMTEIRLRRRTPAPLPTPSKSAKPKKHIPIALFHDLFGHMPRSNLFLFQRLKIR